MFCETFNGIQYERFIDYRTGKSSDDLPLPSNTYWKLLQDVLIQYIRHNDNKFEYDDKGIAHWKHIIANRIRYIGKESNNLDEVSVLGIDEDSYLEYENFKEFYEWILSLKPKDVRAMGISKKTLWNIKHKIRNNENFKHKSKPLRTLRKLYIMK